MQTPTDAASDTEIIRLVMSGDVNAFEKLVERYQSHVFAVVGRHVPKHGLDEVAHDVFVRAYRGLSGFSGKSGFKAWLSGIATRACYDFWRAAYRNRETPLSSLTDDHRKWLENALSTDAAADELARRADAVEILDYALDRLSAEDRMIVNLIYFEGHSHKETAALLGWSVANVKIRAWRIRKKLYCSLMEKNPDQGAI